MHTNKIKTDFCFLLYHKDRPDFTQFNGCVFAGVLDTTVLIYLWEYVGAKEMMVNRVRCLRRLQTNLCRLKEISMLLRMKFEGSGHCEETTLKYYEKNKNGHT